jgi:hypothetical protein
VDTEKVLLPWKAFTYCATVNRFFKTRAYYPFWSEAEKQHFSN